eukprot:403344304
MRKSFAEKPLNAARKNQCQPHFQHLNQVKRSKSSDDYQSKFHAQQKEPSHKERNNSTHQYKRIQHKKSRDQTKSHFSLSEMISQNVNSIFPYSKDLLLFVITKMIKDNELGYSNNLAFFLTDYNPSIDYLTQILQFKQNEVRILTEELTISTERLIQQLQISVQTRNSLVLKLQRRQSVNETYKRYLGVSYKCLTTKKMFYLRDFDNSNIIIKQTLFDLILGLEKQNDTTQLKDYTHLHLCKKLIKDKIEQVVDLYLEQNHPLLRERLASFFGILMSKFMNKGKGSSMAIENICNFLLVNFNMGPAQILLVQKQFREHGGQLIPIKVLNKNFKFQRY